MNEANLNKATLVSSGGNDSAMMEANYTSAPDSARAYSGAKPG